MFTLLVATTASGKIKEIKQLLQSRNVTTVGLGEVKEVAGIDVEETGTTFAENAALKAKTYGRLSGLITLADDSGLCVAALDGRPGIQSKRYADTESHRIDKLLEEMKDVPEHKRQAWFICNMAIYDPSSDKTIQVEGKVNGTILTAKKGTGGFGYDPIFFCPELGKTFGEATDAEKNTVSHRGIAMTQMITLIRKHFARKR